MSQKVGKQFKVEYKDKPTQRINRYYITTSKEGGSLMKVKENGQKVSLAAGQNIMLFNDYVDADDYQIDYQYYIRTAKEVIDFVEHEQLALF